MAQSAQNQAKARGHQQFTREHILKVVLEDRESLASSLIRNAGGEPDYGARPPKRAIQRSMQDPAATLILEGIIRDGESDELTG